MKILVDPHTHTLASGHAFGTIGENARCARALGLEAISMSDHFSSDYCLLKEGRPAYGTTMNMEALPKVIEDVRILASAEIDIVDLQGHLYCYDYVDPGQGVTLLEHLLATRDIAIASVHHFPGCHDGTLAQNTEMYCRVLRTPGIHIIGHPGRAGLRFDIDEVLAVAKETGKMIEINEHSFDFPQHIEVCRQIAQRCGETGVHIVVSSDAHSPYTVGKFDRVQKMLKELCFPEELVANRTLASLLEIVRQANLRQNFHNLISL